MSVCATLHAGLDRLERLLSALAGGALLAMMALICADAAGRYLLGAPLPAAHEIVSQHLLVPLVFALLAVNYTRGDHVRLNVAAPWLQRLPGGAASEQRLVAALSLLVFIPFGWAAAADAALRLGRVETTLGTPPLPVWLSHLWVAVGVWALIARLALDAIAPRAARAATDGADDDADKAANRADAP